MRQRPSLMLLGALLCFAVAAHAQPSVFMEELTSPELRELIRTGTTTVIVPAGGTEQNGPHMTLGKHNVRVHRLAGRIASAVGHTVVAPVLAYVPEGRIAPPEAHMRFAGTISIPPEAFRATLEGAARSFKQHGFKDIVFIGDHGGYQADLEAVARNLNRAWAGSGVRAHHLGAYYRASQLELAQMLRGKGLTDAQIGIHAGSADTALQLATAPETVRSEQFGRAAREGAAGGTTGDPQAATVALGQAGADLVVAQGVAALRAALAAPGR
jgi:creatinine amidohydrolase/Fe(II)-dependent formamide hydrolase-like protein